MIGFNSPKAPPFLLEKMNNLCSLLRQEKKDFEQVASIMTNKDLRSTILTLATESNQYACELSSQIHTMGGMPALEEYNEPEVAPDDTRNLNNEDEILTFCKLNEDKMISAYQEILNEPSLYDGVTKMIRYQLNQIVCAFTHVNQLNALKFRN